MSTSSSRLKKLIKQWLHSPLVSYKHLYPTRANGLIVLLKSSVERRPPDGMDISVTSKRSVGIKGGKICQVEVAEMVSWRNWEIVTIWLHIQICLGSTNRREEVYEMTRSKSVHCKSYPMCLVQVKRSKRLLVYMAANCKTSDCVTCSESTNRKVQNLT